MHPHALRRDRGERMVQRLDMEPRPFTEFLDRQVGILDVPTHRQVGAVDLHSDPGLRNRLVLATHRLRDREQVRFLARAIIDWATRRVLSWRLSNTLMTAGFCVAALSEALARFGKPGIFNTDQGAQFTSDEFTQMLRDRGIEISMDGRGRCHDNIFVERLWWTVKHEWVYLRPAADGIEQKRSLVEFFDWYNLRRPHRALRLANAGRGLPRPIDGGDGTGRLMRCR